MDQERLHRTLALNIQQAENDLDLEYSLYLAHLFHVLVSHPKISKVENGEDLERFLSGRRSFVKKTSFG